MNTENGIVKYIKEDKHTKYMACAQYIDWILGNLVQNIREAYIVQEVYYINASDKEIKSVHYFEAWKIEDGICIKRDGQECDDLFCVGHPLDDSDTFKDSIGHEGIIAFIPRVFVVMGNSKLFDDIKSWPSNEVKKLMAYLLNTIRQRWRRKFINIKNLEETLFVINGVLRILNWYLKQSLIIAKKCSGAIVRLIERTLKLVLMIFSQKGFSWM